MLFSVKIFNLNFLTEEINMCKMISLFASNLYYEDNLVSTEDIEVLNFEIKEEVIEIIPTNNNVILPISGIISCVKKDYIIIESSTNIYKIYDIESNYNLYQYYKKGNVLGHSDKYIIITNDIQSIVEHFILNHEEV